MYADGRGVTKDTAKAMNWYRLAADHGDAEAQILIGWSFENGTGVPKDYAEAVKWYRLAADHGDAGAQFMLALMYENAKGVPKDLVLAYSWYNLAVVHRPYLGHLRDELERRMTSAQIAEAQRISREWKPN
jgi:TPR repeat protein